MIICFVKGPDGKNYCCEVKEIIPTLYQLLPEVVVKALEGKPFNGSKIAIVNMINVKFGGAQNAK